MKTLRLLLVLTLFIGPSALPARAAEATGPSAQPTPALPSTNRLPGVDMAEGISTLTGVAISPLLGVSATGAWRYWHAAPGLRSSLPWFCQPWAWGTGLLLLGICLLKDTLGATAPALLKKPFDIAELFENKLSALVASAAFVPYVVAQMAQNFPTNPPAQTLAPGAPLLAVIQPAFLGSIMHLLLLPLAILAFLTVWLASHMVHALIVFSPHGILDALLKLGKSSVLLMLLLFYFINPYIALAFCLVILLLSALVAGFSLRLMTFATLLSSDLVCPGRAKRAASPAHAHAFIARRVGPARVRAYGRVDVDAAGQLQFAYRPFFILPTRKVALPAGQWAISKGLFFPSLLYCGPGTAKFQCTLHFLPRYRGLESAVAGSLGVADVRDNTLLKGIRSLWAWLVGVLSVGRAAAGKQGKASYG